MTTQQRACRRCARRRGRGTGGPARIELEPLRATIYRLGQDDTYHEVGSGDRLAVSEPFAMDVPLVDLLPRWARSE